MRRRKGPEAAGPTAPDGPMGQLANWLAHLRLSDVPERVRERVNGADQHRNWRRAQPESGSPEDPSTPAPV